MNLSNHESALRSGIMAPAMEGRNSRYAAKETFTRAGPDESTLHSGPQCASRGGTPWRFLSKLALDIRPNKSEHSASIPPLVEELPMASAPPLTGPVPENPP